MDSQHHFICRRRIVERFLFIPQPQQLLFAVTFADVGAELDERCVHGTVHGIRLRFVTGAFDSDCSLVIRIGRRTPTAVLFLDTKRHTTIRANAVVAACLTGRTGKAAADALRRKLADHTMRSDSVNAVGSLPRMVRGEFGVNNEWTIGISHNDSSLKKS